MTVINGENTDISGITIGDYVLNNNYDKTRIAVEKNGDLVRKADYDCTMIEEGDTIEIVSFVGGG